MQGYGQGPLSDGASLSSGQPTGNANGPPSMVYAGNAGPGSLGGASAVAVGPAAGGYGISFSPGPSVEQMLTTIEGGKPLRPGQLSPSILQLLRNAFVVLEGAGGSGG